MLIIEIFIIIAGLCLMAVLHDSLKSYHCRDCGHNFGISDGTCPKCKSVRIMF